MKKVLVLLEVTVDRDVPAAEVRDHIASEARASRGYYIGNEGDWRADIEVVQKSLSAHINKQRKIGRRTS